ncbi:MAG: methionine--tRNA ligase [Candidatus Diapherotrites archaeon]|nr:methionine--tRNA ligase [Candidatus Diapherotrites archaeon]
MQSNKRFYITTAIDYPNAKPHLGHAYEKVLADCIARWNFLLGKDVFFLTGTDEHGLKIQRAAAEQKMNPKEFVDKQVKFFKEAYSALDIEWSRFIRTTDADHEELVQKFFEKLYKDGYIYMGKYKGLYCVDCEAFYTAKDLINGSLCPVHKRKCEIVEEESYFFKLSKFQDKLIEFIEKNPNCIFPDTRRNEVLARLKKEKLHDLSVSRLNVEWGIPVPFDKKHTIYVWFDALLNYLTGIKWPSKKFRQYWPALHLIGKDIVWFHTAIWFSMLMAAKIKLPKIVAHGFINLEGNVKMSKSKGNVIDPIVLAEKYSSNAVRYYLLREIPFGEDGYFSEKALIERNNTELADSLGNLLNRVLVLIEKKFNGVIPKAKTSEELSKKLNVAKIKGYFSKFELHLALKEIFSFVDECNRYINEKQPWNSSREEAATTLYSLADSLRVVAILLWPFMPNASEEILKQLGIKPSREFFKGAIEKVKFNLLKQNKINRSGILFPKFEFKEEKIKARDVKVSVSPELKKLGLKVYSAVIEGVKVKRKSRALEKEKQEIVIKVKDKLTGKEYNRLIEGYEKIYEKLGIKVRNSVRNLVEQVLANGRLPQINTAVDSYNLVSLEKAVVVGAHDIDKLKGDIRFEFYDGKKPFVPLEEKQQRKIPENSFVVVDDERVICFADEKQCDETKIDLATKNIVIYVQGNSLMSEAYCKEALRKICDKIIAYCGGRIKRIDR